MLDWVVNSYICIGLTAGYVRLHWLGLDEDRFAKVRSGQIRFNRLFGVDVICRCFSSSKKTTYHVIQLHNAHNTRIHHFRSTSWHKFQTKFSVTKKYAKLLKVSIH